MPNYARLDLAFERGEGVYLFSTDGRKFLDFGSGVAVNALGHAHPRLVAALKAQAEKLWHCSNYYRVPGQERVAKRLVDATFADTVFFCNSGAEANECALKMARKYQHDAGHPERYRIIAARGAFHGRTLATIAAGGQEKHLHGFEPVMDGFDHVALGNLNELRNAITEKTAAIIVEPIQGEGGIRTTDAEYLRGLRAAADEYGLLLIFDEVQTGVGRTGKLFAYEWAGVTPDIMPVAKGLGGGFPVGACLATEKAAGCMGYGTHGSTFGGNPLAMAAAEALLDVVIDDAFLARVREVSAVLTARLDALVAAHPKVLASRRGVGMMQGLVCVVPNTELNARLIDNGLITILAGDNVIRLLPPLIIGEAEIDEAMAILDRTCREFSA
jgi:acetylornithine/N-succinyldiaminopimelate aminotransferase